MAPEDKAAYVSIREYLSTVMAEREKQLNLRFDATEKALGLAAKELARRLDILNGEHGRKEEERTQFVKVETYNVKTSYYDEWCRGVEKRLANIPSPEWVSNVSEELTTTKTFFVKHGDLVPINRQIASLYRLVYIGLGIVIGIQFIFHYFAVK